MENCLKIKRFLYILLLISLVGFLVLPQNALADVQLSTEKTYRFLNSVQQELINKWIDLTTSPSFSKPEKQAALFLIRNAIQQKELEYAFVELPKEYLEKIVKIAISLAISPDAGTILDKIEKESVKKAISTATEWLLQNEIKVGSGTLTDSFTSYKDNPQKPIFYYNLAYRPLTEKEGEMTMEFYSPEGIEPQDPTINVLGLKRSSWEFDAWRAAGNEKIEPFIVRVKGKVTKIEGGGYIWSDTSVEVTFSEPVPEIPIEKPLSFWEKVKKFAIDFFTEQIQNVFHFNPFSPAAVVTETPLPEEEEFEEEELEEELEVEEPSVEVGQEMGQEVIEPRQKPKSKTERELTKEEIQEILDSISEKIKVINEGIAELREAEEKEIDETEETKEEELEEEEEAPVTICEIIPGSSPTRNKIIINEVAWMGTVGSYNDEWIELKNISGSEIDLSGWQLLDKEKQIKIIFNNGSPTSIISASEFLLLERTDDDSVPGVAADLIYTGGLKNSDEALYLFDKNCQLQDEVLADLDWPAGDNSSKRTMERKSNLEWQTSANSGGTPKSENSGGYYEYQSGGSSSGGSSSGGGSSSDTTPPIANAGPDQTVVINQPISFDGTQSTDNLKITSYKWDVNQDSQWDLEGKKVTYKDGYQVTGKYIVTLQVSDKAGNSATDTLIITAVSPPEILITEIQFESQKGVSDEFIELYNPNNESVNLNYSALKKKTSGGNESNLVSSAKFSGTIAFSGYFLIVPQLNDDGSPNYQGEPSPDLYYSGKTYSIAANNTALLYDPWGNLIDEMSWEEVPVGRSYGRKWDETSQAYLDDFEIQIPTPKAKNQSLPPEISSLQITSPEENQIFNTPQVLIEGTAEAGLTVFISDSDYQTRADETGNWQITVTLEEGQNTFNFKAKDENGNESQGTNLTIFLDTIPPQTEILTFPPSLTNQTEANFTFRSDEENCVFECQLKVPLSVIRDWEDCQSPKIYSDLTDNTYTFSVRAKDEAGNLELEIDIKEHTWIIDTEIESPSLILTDFDSGSSSYTNAATVKVTISNDEGASAWFLSENQIGQPDKEDSNWQTENRPSQFSLSESDGPKTVYIWTKDETGNISRLGNSASIILDTSTLEVSLNTKPADPTNQTEAAFTFSSNKENSIFECQIDEGDWQGNCLSPATFSDLDEGSHAFQVKAADLAGNISGTLNYSWTIDLTPPEVNFQEISSPQTQTSFLISWAGEGEFQFRYSDDETNWIYYPESGFTSETEYQFSGEDETTYYFQVKAKDGAGNESKWKEMSITISLPKPLLEVNKEKLEFEGIEFGLNPEPQSFTILNSGQADLEWEITIFPEVDWLVINPISGQILPDNCSEISVSVNISDFCSGQYFTKIFISSNGGSKEIELSLNLDEDNIPPTAEAGPDQTVEVNQNITFDASNSSDNARIVSYQWDINNDGNFDLEEVNPTLEGGYSDPDEYLVTLQVSDGAGNTSTDTLLITVLLPYLPLEVVINEIAWMGTKAESNDEWIELYNNTDEDINLENWTLKAADGTPAINLSGTILANDYYLLERTSDNTISTIDADQIYTGALHDDGEKLELKDGLGDVIDLVDCSGGWFAGQASPNYITMERIKLSKSDSNNWADNNLITKNGLDAEGNKINGTPKSENSVSKSSTEISGSIDFPTLTYLGSPYIVKWELAISQGKTLTIEPGVVIKFKDGYSGMRIDGTLKAIGTEDKKILFTSYRENPEAGDWKQIYFSPESTNSQLENIIVRYGGYIPSSDAPCPYWMSAIRVDEHASIILKDSLIENNESKGLYLINSPSATIIDNVQFFNNLPCQAYGKEYGGYGILIDGGSPTVENSTFERNIIGIEIRDSAAPKIKNNIFQENEKPIYLSDGYPSFQNNQMPGNSNTFNGVFVAGWLNLEKDTTWQADLPYIVEYSLTILPDTVLTLNPGVVIKFLSGHSEITVNGTLKAIGNPNEEIVFTSYRDADYGGSGGAAAGDWKQIYFSPTSTDSKLDNVIIRYGGAYPSSWPPCPWQRAAVRVDQSSITLKNSIIEQNKSRGLYLIGSSSTIDNVKFLEHRVGCGSSPAIALLIDGDSPTIKNSTFKNNYYGIYIQSGQPTLENLTFGENDEKNNINIYPTP